MGLIPPYSSQQQLVAVSSSNRAVPGSLAVLLRQRQRVPQPCRFLPFGRNIFEAPAKDKQPKQVQQQQQNQQSQAQQVQQAEDHEEEGSAEEMQNIKPGQPFAQLNPYSVFIALLIDHIVNDPSHPGFQPEEDIEEWATSQGRSSKVGGEVDVAVSLWSCLHGSEKELFYSAFTPFCTALNQEMAASGVRATELLKRVRVHGSGLPAHVKEPLNQAMLSAINRRALLFSTEDIDGSSSDTIQEQSRLLPGHESDQQQQEEELMADQHGDSISDVTMQRLTVDEQDGEALRLALLAAGHPSSAMALMHRSATQGLSSFVQADSRDLSVPEVSLVTNIRAQPAPEAPGFWGDFMGKCRLAWDVFFPAQSRAMSSAGAMRSRLQMILVSDRSGLDLPTMMAIKNRSLAALAESHGWESLSELELQVASQRASGERVKLRLPLSQIPSSAMRRDIEEYDYEYEDDDDYFDEDDGQIAGIAEAGRALPQAGARAFGPAPPSPVVSKLDALLF